MEKPLIAVNLLLYRPGIYLEPCLASILAQGYKNFELLIIDNNSQDGAVERVNEILARRGAGIKWRLIVNDENLGYAKGHNLGIARSGGDLVVLVNQDIVMAEDFLAKMAAVFVRSGRVGSVQGKLKRLKVFGDNLEKTDIIDTVGLIMLKNRRIIAAGQGQKDTGQFELAEEIFGVDGALPVYRRAALEDVKINAEYLDEDFFMYKEDVDLAWRLRLYGWDAWYEPQTLAWHARTAGDSAQTGYWGIIKERLKINKFAKFHSFKNQRLMQIKNEQPCLLLRHWPGFFFKEIASWFYVIIWEGFIWKSVIALCRLAPRAWRKRKIIMARKRVGCREMSQWFK